MLAHLQNAASFSPPGRRLSPTQSRMMTFISDYIAACGCAPTQREIAANCFISKTVVVKHLTRLQLDGLLTWQPGRSRSIKLTTQHNAAQAAASALRDLLGAIPLLAGGVEQRREAQTIIQRATSLLEVLQ